MIMEDGKLIKVYRVKVNEKVSQAFWYSNHLGKEFTCVLKTKYCANMLTPVFFIISFNGVHYSTPLTYFTIRPEDCTVVGEETVIVGVTLYEFVRRTMADQDAGTKLKKPA